MIFWFSFKNEFRFSLKIYRRKNMRNAMTLLLTMNKLRWHQCSTNMTSMDISNANLIKWERKFYQIENSTVKVHSFCKCFWKCFIFPKKKRNKITHIVQRTNHFDLKQNIISHPTNRCMFSFPPTLTNIPWNGIMVRSVAIKERQTKLTDHCWEKKLDLQYFQLCAMCNDIILDLLYHFDISRHDSWE